MTNELSAEEKAAAEAKATAEVEAKAIAPAKEAEQVDLQAGIPAATAEAVKEVTQNAQAAVPNPVGDGKRSADVLVAELIQQLKDNPTLLADGSTNAAILRSFASAAKIRSDADEVRNYEFETTRANAEMYKIVVGAVGVSLVLVVLSIATISIIQIVIVPLKDGVLQAMNVPDGLVALGSAAVGALAGLLTPLSSQRR